MGSPLANLLASKTTPNRGALLPLDVQAMEEQARRDRQERARQAQNPFAALPVLDPLAGTFEEAVSEGGSLNAQDFGASPPLAKKLGDMFAAAYQFHPAASIMTPIMNAATSDEPANIFSATQAAVSSINPLGKLERMKNALPEPEITPTTPSPASPVAEVMSPAVKPVAPGPPLRSSLISPEQPQFRMPSREILTPGYPLAFPVGTGHGAAPAGTVGMRGQGMQQGGRISQRVPTSVNSTENPYTDNLLINMDVLRSQPEKVEQTANLISTYPGFGSKTMLDMPPEMRLDAQRKQMTDNLLYLFDKMAPEERQRAMQWYLGANRISLERAAETGFHPYGMAGNYAGLSPQKDWFQNVDLGNKVARTMAEDPRLPPGAERFAQDLYAKNNEFEELKGLEGMRVSEMDPKQQAMVIRLMDEMRMQETGDKTYRAITPEGDVGGLALDTQGRPDKLRWQTTANIEKAVRSILAGSDPQILSDLMGNRHKVRDFYNNIVAPLLGRPEGDITADTHQIAASLFRPLGGSSPEVNVGLGGGAPGSDLTGLRGTYPVYADATRHAAFERNMPVHAMQSIPWEQIRVLFPKAFKTAPNQTKIDAIWRAVDSGEITPQQARDLVVEAAGGIKKPTW